MKKHEMKCTNCNSTGSMQTQQGQVFPCGQCQGTGAVNRPKWVHRITFSSTRFLREQPRCRSLR